MTTAEFTVKALDRLQWAVKRHADKSAKLADLETSASLYASLANKFDAEIALLKDEIRETEKHFA